MEPRRVSENRAVQIEMNQITCKDFAGYDADTQNFIGNWMRGYWMSQKNLTVIDQAITESREALRSQPANASAQSGLFDALRTKVALLQQTVELINDMRKGNQAEAGRRVQTLAQ